MIDFLQWRLIVYCAIKTKSLNIAQVNVRLYRFSAGVPCFVCQQLRRTSAKPT
jgi:hypothetical protein